MIIIIGNYMVIIFYCQDIFANFFGFFYVSCKYADIYNMMYESKAEIASQ